MKPIIEHLDFIAIESKKVDYPNYYYDIFFKVGKVPCAEINVASKNEITIMFKGENSYTRFQLLSLITIFREIKENA